MKTLDSFLTIDNRRIHYKYLYTDASLPTMLILPGGPGFSGSLYEPQIQPFLHAVNVILYDPRGCGKSDTVENDNEYGIDTYISDAFILAKTIADKFGFNKIIVNGTSYGSMAAIGFTLAHPDIVEKMILIAGAPSHDFIQLAKIELEKRGDDEQKAIANNYLWPGKMTSELRNEFFYQLSPLYINSLKKKELAYSTDFNADAGNYAFRNNFFNFDFTPRLNEINCATLILAGRHDWINPPALAEITHAGIKDSKLIIFENAAHSMSKDVPEQYQHAIKDFINN